MTRLDSLRLHFLAWPQVRHTGVTGFTCWRRSLVAADMSTRLYIKGDEAEMIVMEKLDVKVSKNDTDAFFQCVTNILLLVSVMFRRIDTTEHQRQGTFHWTLNDKTKQFHRKVPGCISEPFN